MQKQNVGLILGVKTCETHELPKSQGKWELEITEKLHRILHRGKPVKCPGV